MRNIFVLLTMVSLFKMILWASVVCCLGPPLARCMVRRRESLGGCGLSYISAILVLTVTIFTSKQINQVSFFKGGCLRVLVVSNNEICGSMSFIVSDKLQYIFRIVTARLCSF